MMRVLSMVMVAAVALGGARADDIVEIDDDGEARELGSRPNPAHCYKIKNDWWFERGNEKSRDTLTRWDAICSAFDGIENFDACQDTSKRSAFLGMTVTDAQNTDITISQEDLETTLCHNTGAKSERCMGNMCAWLNDKSCTHQKTGGLCRWYTKAQARRFGPKYGIQYGCHVNRCHTPETSVNTSKRKKRQACEALSIKGLVTCGYCFGGPGDPELKGLGMGCQATKIRTKAGCEFVNDDIVDDATIMQQKRKSKCQCSTRGPFCFKTVYGDSSREAGIQNSAYEARFPGGDS